MKNNSDIITTKPTHWVGHVSGNVLGNHEAWASFRFEGTLEECEDYCTNGCSEQDAPDCTGGGLVIFEIKEVGSWEN